MFCPLAARHWNGRLLLLLLLQRPPSPSPHTGYELLPLSTHRLWAGLGYRCDKQSLCHSARPPSGLSEVGCHRCPGVCRGRGTSAALREPENSLKIKDHPSAENTLHGRLCSQWPRASHTSSRSNWPSEQPSLNQGFKITRSSSFFNYLMSNICISTDM